MLVYNPTGVCRDGMIQVAGQPAFVKDVPAWGWKVVRPEMLKDSGEAPKATPTHMENRFYSIELDETGCLTGIYDKINRRQVLTGRANVLEAFDDHPRNCDNWEISNYYTEKKWEVNDVQSLHVEQDAQTARVVIRRRFLHSTLEQTITIYRERPGIDFSLCADWHERHIFLKTAFPVDILFRTRRLMRSNMVRSNVRRIRILRGMRPNLRSVRRSGRIMPRPVTAWRF